MKFLDLPGISWPWPGPGLSKTGLNLNLVVGVSLDVIESTSFSSPTGFPDPQEEPGDPPGGLPGGFGKICIFFFFKKQVWDARVDPNLLAVTRSRFAGAGDGSRRLNRLLMAITRPIKNDYRGAL